MVGLSVAEAYQKWGEELMGYAAVLVGVDAAPDVVSDALVKLIESRHWPGAEDKRAYMFRSVLNAARMHHRSAGRRRARERWAATSVVGPTEPEPGLAAELVRLSPRQRAVIYLTYWDDLTPGVIAGMLDISEGSVRRHLARARERLRKALVDDD